MFDLMRAHVEQSTQFSRLLNVLSHSLPGAHVSAGGLCGSSTAFLLSLLTQRLDRQILVISPERSQCEQLAEDLCHLHDGSVRLFDPRSDYLSPLTQSQQYTEGMVNLKTLVESRVDIIVAPFDALAVRLPKPDLLRSSSIKLQAGNEHDLTSLVRQLNEAGFERKDFVGVPGEYSLRGGILDVFSHAGVYPMRMEFLGDTIESIREFDPLSQKSLREISVASITPNLFGSEFSDDGSARVSTIFEYLNDDAIALLIEPELIWKRLEEFCHNETAETTPIELVRSRTNQYIQLHLESFSSTHDRIDFNTLPQPSFNGNMQVLRKHLLELLRDQIQVFITCDGQAELKRLRDLVTESASQTDTVEHLDSEDEIKELLKVEFVHRALYAGFILREQGIACYTEHQIFGRQKRREKSSKARVRGFSQKELQQLHKGDFVVHEEFGIGRFDGLKRISVKGVEQEVMKLLYEEKDTLYVNLNYLNKVTKYSSNDGHVPKLTRLGTQEWNKLKAKAKKRIQDIARDLIRLYARRKSTAGYAFQPDTPWQKELEASFIYEDTFDQARATRDVKQDMEQPFPMDRLVCGDVGFGKTEVAVRAAFKAVLDGKQAAVLVPTTILAIQHFNTFLERTSRFSVRVSVLSRLKSKHEQERILGQLKSGGVDIIIGTHRLLSKDVHFKDLGLLVIDEEHRFGVAAKEKLRHLRATVDTLTLTATPIPRTLHFSLLGARDLSIIATPPRNRLPITTEVRQFDEDLIREAVVREVGRGGQAYFVHDRVHDIELWTDRLRSLLPSLRIRHAHGQMHAHQLEEVMLMFQNKDLDVLVCTKIIESGLDIPNVNTIIINRADRFGMSELYQLKGRVGRSNIQAYAYLLIPPVAVLSRTTIQRLQAIEEHTDLGSGFNLAMRDLEIRGAGNLLGAEQSGYIESMGFETYTRILDEAVTELKEQEFKDLFPEEGRKGLGLPEAVVEVELEAVIPQSYVHNDTERLEIYRRMYGLSTHAQLMELGDELKDRFGSHPPQVQNLLNAIEVRLAASAFGFKKVLMGKDSIEIDFPPESATTYYESKEFQTLMTEISGRKKQGVQLRQDGKTLKMFIRPRVGPAESETITVALKFLIDLAKSIGQNSIPPESVVASVGK